MAVFARLKNTEMSMLKPRHVRPYRKNIRNIIATFDFGNSDQEVIKVAKRAITKYRRA